MLARYCAFSIKYNMATRGLTGGIALDSLVWPSYLLANCIDMFTSDGRLEFDESVVKLSAQVIKWNMVVVYEVIEKMLELFDSKR